MNPGVQAVECRNPCLHSCLLFAVDPLLFSVLRISLRHEEMLRTASLATRITLSPGLQWQTRVVHTHAARMQAKRRQGSERRRDAGRSGKTAGFPAHFIKGSADPSAGALLPLNEVPRTRDNIPALLCRRLTLALSSSLHARQMICVARLLRSFRSAPAPELLR